MTRKTLLVASLSLALTCGAPAAVFTRDAGGDGVNWEDPSNWNANALPGAADLVFSAGNGSTRHVNLSSDQTIDALRFVNGDDATHTAGTLTVGSAGPDTESSCPGFGPAGGTSSPDQTGRQLAFGVPSRICRAQSTM